MTILGNLLSYVQRVFGVYAPGRVEGHRGSSGERVDTGDVLALSSALACVKLLSGTIATLPLGVFIDKGDGHSVPQKDHPLWRLLHRAPNPEQTVVDFWEGGVASLELKGNLLARKARGVRGDVVALLPLAWDYVSVRRNDAGELRYRYDNEDLPGSEVLHIRGFGGSPLGGLSTIAVGCETFSAAKAVNKAASSMFANGVRSSGAISMPKDERLGADQRKEVRQLIEENYAGAHNAGRPFILDNGMTWQAITINPDEAQLLESRGFSIEEVCRIFGVPPHMIGHTEKNTSWGTGIEQQTLAFLVYSLRTRLKRIETALEQQLLTPEDIAKGVSIQFNVDALLRADSKGRAEVQDIYLRNKVYTINDVRKMEGKPPVAWGDVPWVQQQDMQMGQPGQAPGPGGQP